MTRREAIEILRRLLETERSPEDFQAIYIAIKTLEAVIIANETRNATWYKPEKKLPQTEDVVIATISGQGIGMEYDHAFALARWKKYGSRMESGWELTDIAMEDFIVHAWCDLEPYGGEE